mmetsp:Transcript_15702/g.33182  ORF Transcript_15702/g.33182 Transcript_15702/m.33182 type:complete len:529 (+) Transcript_15702:99-1685(+)
MKLFGASIAAIVVGRSSAFQFNSLLVDVPRSRRADSAAPTPTTFILSQNLNTSRRTGTHMSQSYNEPHESPQMPKGDAKRNLLTSRRAALRQCSSIFSATVCASLWNRREANASEFSETPVPSDVFEPPRITSTAPQFYDESVITPPRPQVVMRENVAGSVPISPESSVAVVREAPQSDPITPTSSVAAVREEAPELNSNTQATSMALVREKSPESNPITSESSVSATTASIPTPPPPAQVILENSEVVQIPVANPATKSTETSSTVTPSPTPAKSGNNGMYILEVGAVGTILAATVSAVTGKVEGNTDPVSPKCKVVMIENEPYGLDIGRRWYKGVDVTINDPVPASDIREYCDAGKVNNDCTATITGFLGDVSSNGSSGQGPSPGQQDTASEVLSYLGSLKDGGHNVNSETAMAFSSYLNILSKGEVDAPASPQLVSDYLNSISRDGIERLNTIENRMDDLESSVNQLPDAISGRLEQWQGEQDERLSNELSKIESFLVTANKSEYPSSAPVNGVNGDAYQSRLPL